jgi:hypothetical protein
MFSKKCLVLNERANYGQPTGTKSSEDKQSLKPTAPRKGILSENAWQKLSGTKFVVAAKTID